MKTEPDPKTAALIQCVYAIAMALNSYNANPGTRLKHVDYLRLDKAYRVGQTALGKESTIPE